MAKGDCLAGREQVWERKEEGNIRLETLKEAEADSLGCLRRLQFFKGIFLLFFSYSYVLLFISVGYILSLKSMDFQ